MAPAGKTDEIAELNLAYMQLAQRLLRTDRERARLLLGVSEELADLLTGMSATQTLKLATSNFVLCSFRVSDLPIARRVPGTLNTPMQELAGFRATCDMPAIAAAA